MAQTYVMIEKDTVSIGTPVLDRLTHFFQGFFTTESMAELGKSGYSTHIISYYKVFI